MDAVTPKSTHDTLDTHSHIVRPAEMEWRATRFPGCEVKVIKEVAPAILARAGGGTGVLIIDDLVDTGQTARVVRAALPGAHLATVYAKPMGRPLVDTFITEVSQDTWIDFPWDTGLAFQPPIRDAGL